TEIEIGTNPNEADTDGDGVNDGDEVKAGTNPTVKDKPADEPGAGEGTGEGEGTGNGGDTGAGEETVKPSVDPVNEGDTEISGEAAPGTDVTVTVKDPEGNTKSEDTATTDDDGKWSVTPDKGVEEGDKVTVEDEKGNSETITVGSPSDDDGENGAETIKPSINTVTEGDKKISGTGKPGSTLTVTVTDAKGKETEKTVTVGKDGTWSVKPGVDLKKGDKVTVSDESGNEQSVVVLGAEAPEDNGNGDGRPTKPMNPSLPWGPSWPIAPSKPTTPEKPSEGEGTESHVLDVEPVKEGDSTVKGTATPETVVTVTITDKDGKEKLKDENVAVDKNGKWSLDPKVDIATGDKVTVTDYEGEEDSEVATPKESTTPDSPAPKPDVEFGSSERCIETGLGVGLPLLFLIPVGLASQLAIPGLKDFIAPINKQIADINARLQMQAGVFNGPLADQMAGINTQLKRFGVTAGSVALVAAGALAIGLLADACAPGASEEGSSK
ncbi:thrombospondin type 3 repeat-containing protein, partial [Corynebacterium sp. HMSC05E07]|uniref:thrombospondin type 3 repeat-containing protein n=1 Tax=Corynebacterium sp. HMSC05E07 TaxID=1581117 RepID=UPI000B2C0128